MRQILDTGTGGCRLAVSRCRCWQRESTSTGSVPRGWSRGGSGCCPHAVGQNRTCGTCFRMAVAVM